MSNSNVREMLEEMCDRHRKLRLIEIKLWMKLYVEEERTFAFCWLSHSASTCVCVVVIVNDVMMSKSLIFSQRASSDIDIQHEPDKSYLLSFFFAQFSYIRQFLVLQLKKYI